MKKTEIIKDEDKVAYFLMVTGLGCIIAAVLLSTQTIQAKLTIIGLLSLGLSYFIYNN